MLTQIECYPKLWWMGYEAFEFPQHSSFPTFSPALGRESATIYIFSVFYIENKVDQDRLIGENTQMYLIKI
jgi:hypothetical protein